MDIRYQDGRSEFFPHEVKDIVYRINKWVDNHGKVKFGKTRIPDTWAKCCLYSANKVNYRLEKIKKLFENPWLECERNSIYKLSKTKYIWDHRWETKAYFILYWMNFSWEEEPP